MRSVASVGVPENLYAVFGGYQAVRGAEPQNSEGRIGVNGLGRRNLVGGLRSIGKMLGEGEHRHHAYELSGPVSIDELRHGRMGVGGDAPRRRCFVRHARS